MSEISFKKWLVALDRSEMDLKILKNIRFWASILQPQQIAVVNVQTNQKEWAEIDNNAFKKVTDQQKKADAHWKKEILHQLEDLSCDINVHIHYGDSLVELVSVTLKEHFDLVVCGKKQSLKSTGSLTEELAKEIEASFLLIPETAEPQCKRILIPSDGSKHSDLALDTAVHIKSSKPKIELIATQVYKVPQGYHYVGQSYEEASYNTQQNSQKKLSEQLTRLGYDVNDMVLKLRNQRSCAEHIQNLALEKQVDLIIAGSKGITAAAYMLMGTTATRMMRHMGRASLLIVKQKGETMNFLSAVGKLMNPE